MTFIIIGLKIGVFLVQFYSHYFNPEYVFLQF